MNKNMEQLLASVNSSYPTVYNGIAATRYSRWDSPMTLYYTEVDTGRTVSETVHQKPISIAFLNLTATPNRVGAILKDYGTAVLKINMTPRLSMAATPDEAQKARQAIATETAAARSEALAKITDERLEVEKLKAQAERDINAALGRPEPKDPTEALLRETRELRAWNRIRPMLDRLEASAIVAYVKRTTESVLASGDEDTLSALRTELPIYLVGRDAEYGGMAVIEMDKAIANARPDYAAGIAAREEMESGCYSMFALLNHAEQDIKQGFTGPLILPAWEQGEAFKLDLGVIDLK